MTHREFELLENIKLAVCRFFDVSAHELLSPSREDRIVKARHIFHYTAHVHFDVKLKIIGNYSGRTFQAVHYSVYAGRNLIMQSERSKAHIRMMIDQLVASEV